MDDAQRLLDLAVQADWFLHEQIAQTAAQRKPFRTV